MRCLGALRNVWPVDLKWEGFNRKKKIIMFELLSILIEDYHGGACNFFLLLGQSQFKAQRLIWIQLFHSNG